MMLFLTYFLNPATLKNNFRLFFEVFLKLLHRLIFLSEHKRALIATIRLNIENYIGLLPQIFSEKIALNSCRLSNTKNVNIGVFKAICVACSLTEY